MAKPPRAPRFAKTIHGGLRSQNGRRNVWWRKRWIAWLESLHMGARLGRGRNYAQLGQVRTLTVLPGEIQAVIQGAEAEPYRLSIHLPPLPAEPILEILNARPVLAAQVAANTLPISLEELIRGIGYSLFPEGKKEVRFRCTCKDWARPCKHLAAALCLFADAIAADPSLLLRFRGIPFPDNLPDLTPQQLPPEAVRDLHQTIDPAAVPRRLGTLPYWRGTEDFRKTLEMAYTRAHTRAVTLLRNGIADLRFPEDIPEET